MPFEKGKSGNPNGKPRGARNRSTAIAENLLKAHAAALVKKALQLALDGDQTCLRICLERLVPMQKVAPLKVDLPDVAAVADIPKLFAAITEKLREGIAPSGAATLIDLAEASRKSLEVVEIESRISALEEASKSRKA